MSLSEPGKQGGNKQVVLVLVPLGTENSWNGYQNKVNIRTITWKSKELPTRLARRRPPCQPGG